MDGVWGGFSAALPAATGPLRRLQTPGSRFSGAFYTDSPRRGPPRRPGRGRREWGEVQPVGGTVVSRRGGLRGVTAGPGPWVASVRPRERPSSVRLAPPREGPLHGPIHLCQKLYE